MFTTESVIPGALQSYVSLAEIKLHLKIDADLTFEDTLISSYIAAAVSVVENYLARPLHLQTTVLVANEVKRVIEVPVAWHNSVISEVAIKEEGAADYEVVADSNYVIENKGTAVKLLTFNDDFSLPGNLPLKGLKITLAEGVAVADLAVAIKQAIILQTTDFYTKRENRVSVENTVVKSLLSGYRKFV